MVWHNKALLLAGSKYNPSIKEYYRKNKICFCESCKHKYGCALMHKFGVLGCNSYKQERMR